MAMITPPKYVRQVLVTLQARGHLAYLVGGCVRDMILGVYPQDWDICTSALPEQVMDIFPDSALTGGKHGTVTVKVRSRRVEVTTFRSEGRYTDHRHPDAVSFVGDLNTDLSRRDFTMNAIALPPDGLVADPFGGVQDIRDRVIRCVGDPDSRFEEDALRMFRALRFSARLNFRIDENTMAAIERQAPLAAQLAPERVRDEVEKLLLTRQPEKIGVLISAGLMDRYLASRPPEELGFLRLNALPRRAPDRWAGLCVMLAHHNCIAGAESFLRALRLDRRTIRLCADCLELLEREAPRLAVNWKRQLHLFGVDAVVCAARCRDALYGGQSHAELRAVLRSGECFTVDRLAVSGEDLLELGLRGPELGRMLDFLLDYVMEYPENNRREILLALARDSEE